MSRPTNKQQLLTQAVNEYNELLSLINSISDEQKIQKGVNGDWSVKDVLAHLHAWHDMVISWYSEGEKGLLPKIPGEGYTWKTTPALNKKIFEDNKSKSLKVVISEFEKSHKQIVEIISTHSNKELFTKKLYKWTGTTSLGAYLISASSSHYVWASGLIKRWTKSI